MLDYKGIEALSTVIFEQSFEKAAQRLFLTQSAISQRIRNLENFYGAPLIIRTLPYRPTELGQFLIGHFKRVSLLESELAQAMDKPATKPQISLGLNRDSLETWFMRLIQKKFMAKDFLIEIIADDQELLLDYFKNGVVAATMSPWDKKLAGAEVEFLGIMEYALVASPQFIDQYFKNGVNENTLIRAPALQFDKNDSLHKRYLEKYFGIKEPFLSHYIPSVQGFKIFVINSFGYALLPKMDIEDEFKNQSLIQLSPENSWREPIYWHYLTIQSQTYQNFIRKFINEAQSIL